MEFIQSKREIIFYQICMQAFNFVMFSSSYLAINFLLGDNFSFPLWTIVTALIIIAAYLIFKGYLEPKKFSFTEEGVLFCDYGIKREMNWNDFEGYELSSFFPFRIKLKARNNQFIELNFSSFTPKKRSEIIKILNKHKPS